MGIIPTQVVSGIEFAVISGDEDGPYVLILHGYGADYYDLIPLSATYRKRPRPTWLFPNGPIEVPIGPNWIGRAWFPLDIERVQIALYNKQYDEISKAFPSEMQAARQKIEEAVEELNIPRSKLVIGGFSQGAVLATDFALYSSERCAGLLILSGTLTNEDNWKKQALQQSGLQFFQSHGKMDPLLPFSKAVELETLLLNGGCAGQLFAFDGGHEIPQSVLKELGLFLEKTLD